VRESRTDRASAACVRAGTSFHDELVLNLHKSFPVNVPTIEVRDKWQDADDPLTDRAYISVTGV